VVPFALALALAPRPATAQSAVPATRAAELFSAAEQLGKTGRWSEACPKYAESYRLAPELNALLQLADCLEKNGRLASAQASFAQAAELASQQRDPREASARRRAKALEPRLTRLQVQAPMARPPELAILRDGRQLTDASIGVALAVDAGEHVIEAQAPGYRSFRRVVTLDAEGTTVELRVPELEKEAVEPVVPAASPATGTAVPRSHGQRVVGYGAIAAGAVGLGLGAVFMVRRAHFLSESEEVCPSGLQCAPGSRARIDELTRSARSSQTSAIVSFALGGVAVSAGVALVLLSVSDTASAAHGRVPGRQLRILPLLTPSAGGILAEQRF
jgi:hypothetical protein